MDNWTIMSPYARLVFANGVDTFNEELSRVAGVKNKQGIWHVPFNALAVVQALAQRHGVEVEAAAWGSEPVVKQTWAEVETKLREGGEVQSWVLDGFLTAYQKEALAFGWSLSGVNFWHPTGCVVADTLIPVRRWGRVEMMKIAELYNFYSGSDWKNHKLEVLSLKDDSLDYHTARDIIFTGTKRVYEVTAEVDNVPYVIKCTKEHRFLDHENNWVCLEHLSVGDKVLVRTTSLKVVLATIYAITTFVWKRLIIISLRMVL